MPLPLLATAGISLLPSLFKGIAGLGQKRRANRINAQDPGYELNNQVIDNAQQLKNRYLNYEMPGYDQQLNRIGTNYASAFNQGVQGATSGADVLDLATKLAYGQGQQQNQLAVQNAIGRDQALLQFQNANALAGREYQNRNAYDREMYQRKLAEKAALTQAANENLYGALDTGSSVLGGILTPKLALK